MDCLQNKLGHVLIYNCCKQETKPETGMILAKN